MIKTVIITIKAYDHYFNQYHCQKYKNNKL